MIVYSNCKINLGLNIINKRNDGFHNIETVFYPLTLSDIIEIAESKSTTSLKIYNNPELEKEPVDKNLCIRTYKNMQKQFKLPPIEIHLYKKIPAGAGLGGGSSNAAFTAIAINKLFDLNLSNDELKKIVAPLGSDCAFFIENKPLFASEKGDSFEDVMCSLSEFYIQLISPKIHISTPEAYKNCIPHNPKFKLKNTINQPIKNWHNKITNDFEKHAFLKYPELKSIKKKLYQSGAEYASMSGSGSAFFGIFKNKPDNNIWQSSYFVYTDKL